MIDATVDRIRALDLDREFHRLAANVAVTSPVALDLLAYEHFSSPHHQAQRIAAIQLRVVHEFAGKLRWLEGVCIDPGVDPRVRAALTSVLGELMTELDPIADSQAAALLEPALLFHVLLDRLRPWLPSAVLALEPDSVLELLSLGIPDYLHPLLRRRYEAIWQRFHQLRQLPFARLSVIDDPPRLDLGHLVRLLEDPQLRAAPCPPAPPWLTLSWVSPWVTDEYPYPLRRPRAS